MSNDRLTYFHKDGKLFAVDSFRIIGLEDDGIGSVLLLALSSDEELETRVLIDESFQEAYARINDIEPHEMEDKVPKS